MSPIANTSELHSRQRWDRALAIIEVCAAFVLTHITYRAIKHFTVVGAWDASAHTNFTPGAVMIGFTLVMLVVCRRSFDAYGLGCKQWRYWLALGLAGSLIILAIDVSGFLVTRIEIDATRPPDPHVRPSPLRITSLAAIVLPGYAADLALLQRRRAILDRIPAAISVLAIAALTAILPLTAAYVQRPAMWQTSLWLFFGAGVGEEVFYRGYIQSRVDVAFGRQWRVLGFKFGVGLIVSSLLFGLVHALNTVDYFHGRFDFGWSMGLQSVVVGVFYGLVRSKTGSVVPGAIMHGLSDIFAFTATVLSRPI
jgi:membrane protease YdiL (CAAX protease family)